MTYETSIVRVDVIEPEYGRIAATVTQGDSENLAVVTINAETVTAESWRELARQVEAALLLIVAPGKEVDHA